MKWWTRCCDLHFYFILFYFFLIFIFWMLSFKLAFSLSSFTFIKRLLSSSLLYAIRVVSSPYPRLLIFLLAILISACDSSSRGFPMMYFAYQVEQAGWQYIALSYSCPSVESVSCPTSGSNCCFLSHIQVSQETGKVVCYSLLCKNFPYVICVI